MLYISSACVRNERISDSIEELVSNGFHNIELSGGSKYYKGFEDDLFDLKNKYGLNYILHNYFPPPKEEFILNLASLDDDIYAKSLEHCERAIALSKKLGLKKFGIHAGYFMDFSLKEIGTNIHKKILYEKEKSIGRFCEGFNSLKVKSGDVELYIENNVLSIDNAKEFQGRTPFMLTDFQSFLELKELIDFKLLLDVAHLNVSAHSLNLNFIEQLDKMIVSADYLHLSDNNGLRDQNCCFQSNSEILKLLKDYNLNNKTLTTETYGNMADIVQSQECVKNVLLIGQERRG